MQKQFINLKIGEVGTLDINLPIIRIGSGTPKVLLICGVHGDETSSLLVIKQLLENLKLERGELSIIPAANPLAQGLQLRECPIDLQDLNRNFPGNTQRGFTDRLAALIFAQAKNCDLVIDLHTFSDPCPIVAIFMNHGSKTVKDKTLDLIRIFNPEVVWQLSTKSRHEKQLSSSLGPKLAEAGIFNFAIEMPSHSRISKEQIKQITTGLLQTFSQIKMLKQKSTSARNNIPIFERQQVYANVSGLFFPRQNLMSTIKQNQIVGEIIRLQDFEKTTIKSPHTGRLIVLKDPNFVRTGDVLFTIGKQVGEL